MGLRLEFMKYVCLNSCNTSVDNLVFKCRQEQFKSDLYSFLYDSCDISCIDSMFMFILIKDEQHTIKTVVNC